MASRIPSSARKWPSIHPQGNSRQAASPPAQNARPVSTISQPQNQVPEPAWPGPNVTNVVIWKPSMM